MKKCYSTGVLALTTGAVLLGSAAAVSALEIKSGNDKVGLKLYGHIDRAVMVADDGDDSKLFHADNTNSESRVGLKAKVSASESLTIGGNVEVQWQANPSDKVSMDEESISSELKERKMEVYFDGGLGRLYVGRGDMASDDTSEIDLSGTALTGNSGVADVGGGFAFYDAAATVAAEDDAEEGSIMVGDVFNQMDGLSRRNRLRYDTPSFGGFTVAVSAGEKERADAALLYSGKMGEAKLEAALAYVDPGEGKDYSQINGSASVLFGSGLNFTLAGGSRDLDDMPAGGDDPTFMYGKIGYKAKVSSLGSTALSVDYGVYENIENQDTGEEGTAYGVQFVQKLSDYNTELFAAYRNFELDDSTSADYEPIALAMAGARIKF
ncbi:MAG: porin [Candidatus Electrothrix sp. YB6]